MNSVYFPALIGAMEAAFTSIEKYRHPKTNKHFNTLLKDGVFHYPFMLVSAGHHYKKRNYIERLGVENIDDVFILADSGGFQIATGIIKNTLDVKTEIFEWLVNFKYAMTLDVPAYYNNNITFDDALEQSMNNYKFFHDRSFDYNTKFVTVIHGKTVEDLDKWVSKSITFDNFKGGYSIGSLAGGSPLFYSLLPFFYMYNKGLLDNLNMDQIFHFLGFTRVKEMIFIEFITSKLKQLNYNFNITYDSSSYSLAGTKGSYYVDVNKRGINSFNISKDINIPSYAVKLPCDGECCKELTYLDISKQFISENNKSLAYQLCMIHNIKVYIDFVTKLRTITDNLVHFPTSLTEYCTIEEKRILDIISECLENKSNSLNIWLKNKDIILKSSKEDLIVNNLEDI